jgi:hypothetical protein
MYPAQDLATADALGYAAKALVHEVHEAKPLCSLLQDVDTVLVATAEDHVCTAGKQGRFGLQ